MTEPKTHTLDAPGAVLHYDVRSNDASTEPVLLLIGSPMGAEGFVWSYPERKPGQPRLIRTDIAVLYVGDEAEKQALLLGEPGIFFTTPGYDGLPLVMLRLDRVDVDRLTELITDAWRMRAP